MRISEENKVVIIVLIVILIAVISFILPIALIFLAVFGIYKAVVWYKKKQIQPEINKRYSLLFSLRDECEKYVELVNKTENKEYIKDYQYLYNWVMYNDDVWAEIIEEKDGKEFYYRYEGFTNSIEYQSKRAYDLIN